MELRRRFVDAFLAADPGFVRLCMAARTTVVVGCAVGALSLIDRAAGWPLTVALLGAAIAMIASIAVNDPLPAEQRVTTALAPLPAAFSVTLGALLVPRPILSDLVFLAIVFGAIFVRRFGPRWLAFGMLALIPYFFSLFLGTSLSALPSSMVAIVVGAACAFVIRFVVLKERRAATLRAMLRALHAQRRIVLAQLVSAMRANDGGIDAGAHRRLTRAVTQLNRIAVDAENLLDGDGDGDGDSGSDGDDDGLPWSERGLRAAIFDVELATENLAAAVVRAARSSRCAGGDVGRRGAVGPERRVTAARAGEVLAALRPAIAALRDDDLAGAIRRANDVRGRAGAPMRAARSAAATERLADAVVQLGETLQRAANDSAGDADDADRENGADGDDRGAGGDDRGARGDDRGADGGDRRGEIAPTTRQAIQATLGSGAAILIGHMISAQRWYWAALAAFVIFGGTQNAGESVLKATSRIGGTLLGVGAAIGVVSLVGGQRTLAIALLFVALFAAIYASRISYGAMVFFITVLLALLYTLLGRFSDAILLLRIGETVAGAVLGTLAVTFVLPIRTRDAVGSAARELLDALEAVVDDAVAALTRPGADPGALRRSARRLDAQVHALRDRTKPLRSAALLGLGPSHVDRALLMFAVAAHAARNLARAAGASRPAAGERLAGELDAARCEVVAAIERLRATARRAGAGDADDPRRGDPRTARSDDRAVSPSDDGPASQSDDAAASRNGGASSLDAATAAELHPPHAVAGRGGGPAALGELRRIRDALCRLADEVDAPRP